MDSSVKPIVGNFATNGTSYSFEKVIGSGAYGAVAQAINTRNGVQVAIKKITRAFAALTLVKRTLREIRILRELKHKNIISVIDAYAIDNKCGSDIYLVMDLMETDLHQIIHSTQKLTEQHSQYFLFQIFEGLRYIHAAAIVHRDLKPSNLLVNSNCLLKIADFGMARSTRQCVKDDRGTMTQYVSTRLYGQLNKARPWCSLQWYRAPEILFSLIDYDTKVDIWSAGCIAAELIQRRQLFPGRDAHVQVKMIVFYLGRPGDEVMGRISSDLVRAWIDNCGERAPLPWSTILPKATPNAIDLMDKLMQVAPGKRYSAEEALSHPYLEPYSRSRRRDGESEHANIELDVNAIERLSADELHAALLNESMHFCQLPSDGH